jgi:acetylornithine/succinyldiaminopimelate/putrescine aminotransferase
MLSERELFFKYLGLPSANPLGLEIKSAEGIYMYGRDGKKYIDLVAGVAVSNVGHRHPKVIQAIKDQLDRHLHLMVYGEFIQTPQVLLAQRLTEVLPGKLDSVYFVNSGSEAIEGALKLSKRYTGRSEIIAFKNAYHGGTHGALSILGNEKLKNAFRPLLPDIRLLEFNNFDDLRYITERTACVVAETIQAEAGIILPKDGFLQALRKRCEKTGSLLVIDDVQMGFGRTGKLFSFENFDIIPDILCLAKGMGGGMPVGAFISSGDIMKALTYSPELGHITTFGGHPVSCAAALANLEVIREEKLHEKAENKGKMFYEALKGHPGIRNIRFKGLMMGVELHDVKQTIKLFNNFLDHGLIVDRFLFNPATFRIAPPLIITKDEINEITGIILSCLD